MPGVGVITLGINLVANKMDLSARHLNHANKLKAATNLPSGKLAHPDAIEQIRGLLFKKTEPATKEERVELLALAEHLAGESQLYVEDKFALSRGCIQRIIRKQFVTQESLLEFVEDCMATNALIANQLFMEKAHEMSAIQAAQAAGIFSSRLVELKKARTANYRPEPIAMGVILQLGEALRQSKLPIIDEKR